MTAPAISVILPVHNVADHVAGCIASLRAQTCADFEAIVIEDGSTDASPERLAQAIGGDPRFRVIAQANAGLGAARNAGLAAVRGRVIGFLDGDDRYDPVFLERMLAALEEHGADWVACGLRNMHPDGSSDTHSALHDEPGAQGGEARFRPLESWDQVIAHFPSAWNKLYRRNLIAGLRFDTGTWFEDHAFFLAAAARSDRLLHLPEPLYLQTRGRRGQITATDSERVFEQFDVLDRLKMLMDAPGKPGGRAALARLAHRLFHERGAQLRDPAQRARFLTAARDWLAGHGLPPEPAAEPPSWALELSGICPLSVIVPWDGQPGPLRILLDSLAGQILHGFETVIVADDAKTAARGAGLAAAAGLPGARAVTSPAPGPGAARNAGLAAARGALVVFADAGDRLMPPALAHWTDEMLRAGADLGISQFRVGLGDGDVHGGFHDMRLLGDRPPAGGPLPLDPRLALSLHCHPTARIFRRAFLAEHGLNFGQGLRADWQIGIGAALTAEKALYFAWPGAESGEAPECRRLWSAPDSPPALRAAIDATGRNWPPAARARLPQGWERMLFARALWESRYFAPRTRPGKLWFDLLAHFEVRRHGWHRAQGPLDPYLSPRLRRMFRASGS